VDVSFDLFDLIGMVFDAWRSIPNTAWKIAGVGGVQGALLYIPSLEVLLHFEGGLGAAFSPT